MSYSYAKRQQALADWYYSEARLCAERYPADHKLIIAWQRDAAAVSRLARLAIGLEG